MTAPDLSKLHVMVVEDDPTTQHLMKAVLKAAGTRVTTAESGMDAVAKLAETDRVVDVILCDYHMPYGNGLQLLKALRLGKVKARPDTCFIVMTSEAAVDVIQTAGRLDVNGYLLKPVTSAKLKQAIEKGRSKYFPVNYVQYADVDVPEGEDTATAAFIRSTP